MNNDPSFTKTIPRLTNIEFSEPVLKEIKVKIKPKIDLSPQQIKSRNSFYLNTFLLVIFIVCFVFFCLSVDKIV